MAIPAVSTAAHTPPPFPSAPPTDVPPPRGSSAAGAGPLPGANGGGRAIDVAALYRADHTVPLAPTVSGGHGPKLAAPLAPAAPTSPAPLRPSNGGGWLTGTVLDSRYLTPVVGANVFVSAGICAYCQSGTTNATGDFVVEGDAGPARVDVLANDYVTNRTFPTIVLGSFTSLGTILLVHYATVEGVVVADLPGHPAIANVSITSGSRDGGLTGPDANVTASNGSFSISVDPLPIEVDYTPPFPDFLPNASFVDPIPWQVVDVGTVALEGNVTVNLSVVDSVTGKNIAGAGAWFCSDRIDNGCLYGGNSSNGSVLFPAVAGPGFVNVIAGGYMANTTQIADVPSGTAGPVKLGTVRLLPMGAVEVTVNFTGATPNGTWPSALPNGSYSLPIVVCPLSGENGASAGDTELAPPGCDVTYVKVGVTTLVPAPPLRDVVMVARDPLSYLIPDGFPLAEMLVPSLLKTLRLLNETWANVTPGEVTYLGSLNLSAGTYLSGTVAVSGSYSTQFVTTATVVVCSVVRASECLPAVMTGANGQLRPIPAGCPTGPWQFCVPAPPGPDHVAISWGPDSGGTWITVPTRCCAQEGHPTPIGTFSFSADLGSVHGNVGVEGAPLGTLPRVNGASIGVEACPADPSNSQCYQGTVDALNGSFWAPAALGWDQVIVSAGGYRSNSTWVDVTGNNSTGTIEVGPVAYVGGQVLSATTGFPVLEAQILACFVANPNVCFSLGSTFGSNGTYNGSVGVTPYPGSAVAIQASATGYDTETTFANLTAGAVTTVPTMRLSPIGASAVPRPSASRSANSSTPTTGSWVVGHAVDARSGLAVGDAQISLCYLSGAGGCQLSNAQTLNDGSFNLTTVHGSYQMWVNGSHYVGSRVYLNASTAGTVDLGSLLLTPLDRITGRILIGPWASLATQFGEGADQVRIAGCDPRLVCGPVAATNTGGFFNASVPAGTPDSITFTGGGLANGGNGYPGFTPTNFALTVTSDQVAVTGSGPGGAVMFLILGGLTGAFRETSGGHTSAAFFTTYGTIASASAGPSISAVTGTGGTYAAFLPDGAYGEQVDASAQGLVPAQAAGVAGTTTAGSVVAGPNLTLTRFGFVDATVIDNTSLFPAVGVGVVVVGSGGPTNQMLTGSSSSNATGSVNISAPPGSDAVTTGGSAFTNWSGIVSVSAGSATAFGQIRLTEIAGGGVAVLRTVDVNTVGTPPLPGVYDNVTLHPVEGTFTVEDSGVGGVHVGPMNGNDLGQFLLSGVASNATNISVAATGFTTFQTGADLRSGSTYVLPRLNLTADGIVEGTVEAMPGNVTVPYTSVVACPVVRPLCPTVVQTNASGVFWVGVPAGLVQFTVQSNIYLANLTQIVNVTPDSFVEMGVIPVFGFATVHGIVRGLPSGGLLVGANVSLCSPFSPPNGCLPDETVTTDANGTFSIPSPPGQYYLSASAPFYNTTRYFLSLNPGANLDLGIVFLAAYGFFTGEVVTTSGAPIANASVLACASWGGGPCGRPATTAADGSFQVAAPPGPVGITVTKFGYLDGVATATAITGTFVSLPPIVLAPVPPNIGENVSGTVRSADSGAPISGALVVAREGGSRVAQTLTLPNGSFHFVVHWGVAQLFAGAPNFAAQNLTMTIHQDVTGLSFSLATMTYRVRGVTTDGGTKGVLGGVQISANGSELALSDANGAFSFFVPNGTSHLVASLVTTGAVQYGAVSFTVVVAGAPTYHNVTLSRTAVLLAGEVVDASSGRAIGGAAVTVWSAARGSVASAGTDSAGRFDFSVAPGTYNVSASAPGYAPANVTVFVGPTGNRTAIALVPPVPLASTALKLPPTWVLGSGAAAFVVVVAATFLWLRRRGPPPTGAGPVDAEYRMVDESST